jgi:pyrroline-5-carboxylate reductase
MLAGDKVLAVIGCGTMGEAIVRGIFRSGRLQPSQVFATDRRADLVKELAARHKMRASTENLEAARAASVALLCLKPQHMEDALDNDAMREALAGKLVISIAAGVRLEQLSKWLPRAPLIRAMPNTPAVIGEGMTVLARGQGRHRRAGGAGRRDLRRRRPHGRDRRELHGRGHRAQRQRPAFAFLVLEALADGAVMMGLRRDVAFTIAAQMLQGSARMVLETGMHPAALKDQVTTPAGAPSRVCSHWRTGASARCSPAPSRRPRGSAGKLGQKC